MIIKVTKKGEVCYDTEKELYILNNETYSDIVAESTSKYEIMKEYKEHGNTLYLYCG